MHGGKKGWMGDGDLGCATDAELAASVAKIKEGADVYAKLSPLQYEFMEEHEAVGADVWRTTYSNGVKVYVNYSDKLQVVDGVTIPAQGWNIR